MRSLLALLLCISVAHAATCTGKDPCPACKTCAYCRYCGQKGHACGVLKKRDAAAASARRKAGR